MPRTPRPDYAAAGTPEPNRSDLMAKRAAPNQPLTAPAGRQPYGSKTAEVNYQRTAPMQNQPGPGMGAPVGPMDAMRSAPAPNILPLTAPSERPNEPLTHGLPSGPGAGPEALAVPPRPSRTSDVLQTLASTSRDPMWADLATIARNLGQ